MREELEIKRQKLRERGHGKFEKRLEKGKEWELIKRCLEEMKERNKEGNVGSDWKEERRRFLRIES